MSTRQSPGEDKTNACCSCSRRFSCRDVQKYCRGGDSRARRNAADPYRPSLKWYALPNCHCEGASRPWQSREGTCSPYRPSLKWYALPNCHCEGASRPWQSHAPTSEFAEVALLSTRVLRDCTPRALPRAARSGRHVGLRPPRNDKPGALHGRRRRAEICNCHRRSTPVKGTPLQTQLVPAIVSIPGTNRRCSAGSGMPLPYNARLEAGVLIRPQPLRNRPHRPRGARRS